MKILIFLSFDKLLKNKKNFLMTVLRRILVFIITCLLVFLGMEVWLSFRYGKSTSLNSVYTVLFNKKKDPSQSATQNRLETKTTPQSPPEQKIQEASVLKPSLLRENQQPFTAATKKTHVSFVIFGLQKRRALLKAFLKKAPPYLTVALSPHEKSSRTLSKSLQQQKKSEILLSIPLEPENFPHNDAGPQTLFTKLPNAELQDRTHWAFNAVPGSIGATHDMGNAFTRDKAAMEKLFKILSLKGALFFDTFLTPHSQSLAASTTTKLPLLLTHWFLGPDTNLSKIWPKIISENGEGRALIISIHLTEQHLNFISSLEKNKDIQLAPLSYLWKKKSAATV